MWGNWKDTSSFGGPSHLRGPHQSICGQEVADAAQGSVFTGPALFTEQGRMGGGLWAVPAGDLHTKVTGPWGLPPPRVHPPLWDVPLHPLQHRLWSGLLGPCLSPGHPVSPPLGSDILPLCPLGCPTALVSPPHLSPAQLQPPSPGKCSLPCVPGVTSQAVPSFIIPSTADKLTSGQYSLL